MPNTRTAGEVIADARDILQDHVTPYRYTESQLFRYLSSALMEARRIRPDLFSGSLRAPVPNYSEFDGAKILPLIDTYYPQVVNYVAGRAELRDDSFAVDGRATALIAAFGASLGGGKR